MDLLLFVVDQQQRGLDQQLVHAQSHAFTPTRWRRS
jgi:hypothetical protein